MAILGFVDRVDELGIAGWAFDDADADTPLVIDVHLGGRYLGSCVAELYGADLEGAGLRQPRSRFSFQYGVPIGLDQLAGVTASPRGGTALPGGFATVAASRRATFQGVLDQFLYLAWDQATALTGAGRMRLTLTGDLVLSEDVESIYFTLNGAPAWSTQLGMATLGPARRFWFVKDRERLGFRTEAETDDLSGDTATLVATLVHKNGARSERTVLITPISTFGDQSALPPQEMIERVVGPEREPWLVYVAGGASMAAQLERLTQAHAGRGLGEFGAILDWGCGCARNTAPIARRAGANTRVVGVDVDPQAIAWAQANAGAGAYQHIDFRPPTGFDAETFDLVFGMSVFTHLSETAQDLWLDELHRIMKPGGLMIASYHGEPASLARPFSDWQIMSYRLRGIQDEVVDPALKAVGDTQNNYRSTFHTTDYVKARWGRVFEIVAIEHGWFGAHPGMAAHSIAICRKAG